VTERPRDTGETCETATCSLSPAGVRARQALIGRLLARGLQSLAPVAGGARAEFRGGAQIAAELEALVALEVECCPFLTLTVRASADRIKLEVTGPPPAQQLIAGLFGLHDMDNRRRRTRPRP
jgi:hypothetical protein